MIHKKIGAFIFQDVQNPNETKTTAVTLRLYALILSVYFLVLFCVCCFLRDVPSSLLTLICSILYVFAFRITYLNHTHFASIFSQLLTLLWITVFIQRFGWDCGVQHFLFVLLVLNFAVSFHRIRTKIFVGICTCAYRLLLYSYTAFHRCQYLHTDHRHFVYFCRTDHGYDYFHPEFPADGTQAYTLQSGTGTHRIHRSPDRAFQPLADV